MSERIDKVLVSEKHVKTRSQAQQLIKKGVVFYKDKLVLKSSFIIDDIQWLDVRGEIEFVGRGALKIKGASKEFSISYAGKTIADIGASTGGFSDFALKNGASKIFAIDVGHGQLAQKLLDDDRVINMEGVNIRYPLELGEFVDIAVVDLSYISLKLTLETIISLVKKNGKVLCLIKPQFEIGKEGLGKNGIVKDHKDHLKILRELLEWCGEKKFFIEKVCSSPIEGRNGNKEFFYLFNKELTSHNISDENLMSVCLKEK